MRIWNKKILNRDCFDGNWMVWTRDVMDILSQQYEMDMSPMGDGLH